MSVLAFQDLHGGPRSYILVEKHLAAKKKTVVLGNTFEERV